MGGDREIDALWSPGRALVTKTLPLYFPTELLPINSQTHLRHFLRGLGEPRPTTRRWVRPVPQPPLLDGLRASRALDGWSTKASWSDLLY